MKFAFVTLSIIIIFRSLYISYRGDREVTKYDVNGSDKTTLFSPGQGDDVSKPTGTFVDEIGIYRSFWHIPKYTPLNGAFAYIPECTLECGHCPRSEIVHNFRIDHVPYQP